MSLNVFGRTLGPGNDGGRQHNPNHQVSITIGKPFVGGVIGAVGQVQSDYGALNIDSKSGAGSSGGDVKAVDTLAAFGQTMMAAVGGDPTTITGPSGTAKVIGAALSSPVSGAPTRASSAALPPAGARPPPKACSRSPPARGERVRALGGERCARLGEVALSAGVPGLHWWASNALHGTE